MSQLPEGFAFWKGFVPGLLGAIFWILVIVYTEAEAGGDRSIWDMAAILAFHIMALPPLWYWVGRPIQYRRNSE